MRRYKVFCSNCGSKLPEGAKFCSQCGERVLEATPVEHAAEEFSSNVKLGLSDDTVTTPAENKEVKIQTPVRNRITFDWSNVVEEPHRKPVADIKSPWEHETGGIDEDALFAEMTPSNDHSRTMSFIDVLKQEKEAAEESADAEAHDEHAEADVAPSIYVPQMYEDVEVPEEDAEMPDFVEPVVEIPEHEEEPADYGVPEYEPPKFEEPSFLNFDDEANSFEELVSAEEPAEEPAHEEPAEAPAEEPEFAEPVAEAPEFTEPFAEEPEFETPEFTEPAAEAPEFEAPEFTEPEEPKFDDSILDAYMTDEPVQEEPVFEEPVQEEPVFEEPAHEEAEEPFIPDSTVTYEREKTADLEAELAAILAGGRGLAGEVRQEEPEPVPVYEEPAFEEPETEEISTEDEYLNLDLSATAEFDAPEMETPEIETPEFEAPEAEVPDFEEPLFAEAEDSLGKVEEPTLEVPTFEEPEFEEPSFLADAEAPEVEEPEFEEPVIGEPEFTEPLVEEPSFEAPDFEATEVETPDFEVPEVETPEIETPDFEAPDFEVPEIETPEVEVPEVEAPEFEAPVFDETVPETETPVAEGPVVENVEEAIEEAVQPVDEKSLFAEMSEAPKHTGMTIAAPADKESEIEALKKRLAELMGTDTEPEVIERQDKLDVDELVAEPVPEAPAAEEAAETDSFLDDYLIQTTDYDDDKEDLFLEKFGSSADAADDGLGFAADAAEEDSDALSIEELEKDLFGEKEAEDAEAEATKKIDKFYTLYRKNEEFQRLLDEEYNKLKGVEVTADEENSEVPTEPVVTEPTIDMDAYSTQVLERAMVNEAADKAEDAAAETAQMSAGAVSESSGFSAMTQDDNSGKGAAVAAAAAGAVAAGAAAAKPEVYEEEEEKEGKALTIIAVIIAVLLVILLAAILILNFAPDSGIALKIDSIIENITSSSSLIDSFAGQKLL